MGVRQNLTVVSMFYKMDCSLPAMLFLKQLLVRQGTPATTLLKAGSLGPGFCGTAFCLSTLECAQRKQMNVTIQTST